MRLTFRSGQRAPSVQQTRHKLLREALHEVLRVAIHAGPDAGDGIGSVPSRAVAALYQVLLNHPIDRRGRCRSCRRPGALLGHRRCRVFFDVDFWLHQPDTEMLLNHLRRELRQQSPESSSRTPAVPPPFLPGGASRAGRPDPDHGGGGEPCPERPRPRRGPPDEPSEPEPEPSAFVGGGGGCLV